MCSDLLPDNKVLSYHSLSPRRLCLPKTRLGVRCCPKETLIRDGSYKALFYVSIDLLIQKSVGNCRHCVLMLVSVLYIFMHVQESGSIREISPFQGDLEKQTREMN